MLSNSGETDPMPNLTWVGTVCLYFENRTPGQNMFLFFFLYFLNQFLALSINGLVNDGNTKIYCLGFILALF